MKQSVNALLQLSIFNLELFVLFFKLLYFFIESLEGFADSASLTSTFVKAMPFYRTKFTCHLSLSLFPLLHLRRRASRIFLLITMDRGGR